MRRVLKQVGMTMAVLAVMWGAGEQLEAAPILLSSPAGFSGNETLLTFEGATEPLTNLGGVSFSLSSGGGAGVATNSRLREFGPGESTAIHNSPPGTDNPYPDLIMIFDSEINRLGFELRTNSGDNIDITLSLMSSQSAIDTFTFSTKGPVKYFFYGFETAVGFDKIVLDVQENGNGFFTLDNLRFETTTPTPEPGTWVLMSTGLVGLLGYGWRRRQHQPA